MSRVFALLLVGVVIVGLAIGVGLGAWQNQGKSSAPVIAQALQSGSAPTGSTPAAGSQTGQTSDRSTVFGTIQTVSDKSFVLDTQSGSVRVNVPDEARILKASTGSVDQIKVGDGVLATCQKAQDGSLSADSLEVGPPETTTAFEGQGLGRRLLGGAATSQAQPGNVPQRERVLGTVEVVGDKEITIKTDSGSTKVKLSDKATVRTATAGSMADLKTGASVVVIGKRDSDGTVVASIVRLMGGQGAAAGSR